MSSEIPYFKLFKIFGSQKIKKVNLKVQGNKRRNKIKIRSLSFLAQVKNDVENILQEQA